MHWSCPHCGISLTVSDDTLGTGWSFSRCYKCGGFALIRRAEVNIIKVDKAPPGERVILPEASSDPANAMLSENATQKLAKHMASAKTHAQQQHVPTPTPPPLNYTPPLTPKASSFDITTSSLPSPLPDSPTHTLQSRTIPIGIAIAAVFAVTSGAYLFIQSQSLWQKAREFVKENGHANSAKEYASDDVIPPPKLFTADTVPKENLLAAQETRPIITDQVQQSAMAPLKPPAVPAVTGSEDAKAEMIEPKKTVAKADLKADLKADHKSEIASETKVETKNLPPALFVKIRSSKANVHSGPGMQFPVIGKATPDVKYVVEDWNNRWFKLSLHSRDLKKGIGWVRNDLVQVLPN
jgi:hypothetical protein